MVGRNAVARKLHAGNRSRTTKAFAEKSPLRMAAVGTIACAPPPSDFSLLPS